MTTIVVEMIKRFGGWILAALSIAGALFVALRSSASVGKAEEKVEAAKEEIKRNEQIAIHEIEDARNASKTEVETIKGANDVQATVNRLNTGDAANELRNKWTRD